VRGSASWRFKAESRTQIKPKVTMLTAKMAAIHFAFRFR
jgi:hypothetical protein